MSLDTVDVVHSLEDAIGAAEHDAREVAAILRRSINHHRGCGIGTLAAEELHRIARAVDAIARNARDATGPDSAIAEWREED